jgi:hypothetical protein
MTNRILFSALLLLAFSFASCTKSIDAQLEQLEKEKLAFRKKLATIKNDSIREKADQLGSMLFMLESINLENQKPPKDTAYEENPYAILADYPNLSSLTNNYLNGIVAAQPDDSETKSEIRLSMPFAFPFQQKTEWKNVTLANQTSVAISEKYQDSAAFAQAIQENWNGEDRFTVFPSATGNVIKPKTLGGIITAKIPKNVLQFKFANNETGDTKEQDGIKVKLVSIKGHAVQLEIYNPKKLDPSVNEDELESYKVVAMDETKQFLDQSGSSTGDDESLAIYKKVLQKIIENPDKVNELEKEVNKLDEEYEKKNKNKVHYTTYYRGAVTDVIVYVLDYSKVNTIKKDLQLPVYPFFASYLSDKDGDQPILDVRTGTVAYDQTIAKSLKEKLELTESELKTKIKISQNEYKLADDKGEFNFDYPKLFSDHFITGFDRFGEVKEINFYASKGGKSIAIPKDSIDLNNGTYVENPWVEFNSGRIVYHPSKFSQKAKYATGIIEVKLADIKKATYNSNQLPKGITINGNKLLIDETIVTGSNTYYVKDKTGKYLKLITNLTFVRHNGTEKGKTSAYYYYGSPSSVDLYTLNNEKVVNYPFEVNLLEIKH